MSCSQAKLSARTASRDWSRPTRRFAAALFTGAALAAAVAYGLPDDSAQELLIEATESTYDASTGVTVLTGAVRVRQGSLRIDASRVTTTAEDGRLSRVVAEGAADQPAKLRQRINPDDPFVTAQADRIDYSIADERLELTGNAVLEQNDREIAADVIFWHIKEGRVSARSDRPDGVTGKWRPKRTTTSD